MMHDVKFKVRGPASLYISAALRNSAKLLHSWKPNILLRVM